MKRQTGQAGTLPGAGRPMCARSRRTRRARVFVNVHVGGIVRTRDGRHWQPTLDIHSDVHQVVTHGALVLAATARGLALSHDRGGQWQFVSDGLPVHYCRAVAVADGQILLSASAGPGGQQAALYRAPLGGPYRFARCRAGLPEQFSANLDTGCLAAQAQWAVLGTADGRVFLSEDGGTHWRQLASGLPPVRAVALGEEGTA